MLLIGHRGAPAEAPENTLTSFDAALRAGVDGLELDLRLTADGAIVVSHDDDLVKRWGVRLRISEATLDEVRAVGEVPTAREVLERYAGRTRLYLECKGIFEIGRFVSAEPVVRALAPLLVGVPDVTVSSFDPFAVSAARALGVAAVGVGCAEMFDPHAVIDAAGNAGYGEVHPADPIVDASVAEHAARLGVRLMVWTVNDPARAAVLRDLGVAGIFSDDPRALRAAGV